MLRRVFGLTLLTLVIAWGTSAFGQAEKPPLKVAMLIPIEPWDRKAGLEAFRDWLDKHYQVEAIWIEPAVPQPTKDTPEAERKAYYANPPAIPDLGKAEQADVIFTALTHVQLNEKDTVTLLKLLTTKPVVGGRRSHHAMGLKLPQGTSIPGIESAGKYGEAIFGGGYAGHHGGTQQFKEGQENHPLVKGLPELVKFSLYDRGYAHKIVADDVTVLIEMKDSHQPQTWCRINKDTKQRTFYTVHDPVDIEKHECVRVMLARALFWAVAQDEAAYRK